MIRCTNCNTINSPDALFCTNCNSFLEWTGVKATADEIAAAKAGVAPAPPDEADKLAGIPALAKPEPGPEPEAEPEPEGKPEPLKREPAPEPAPKPQPEPAAAKSEPEREPEPAPEPKPERTERPHADDNKNDTAAAARADQKTAVVAPEAIEPAPEPDSEPEPKPQPKPAPTMRAKPRPKPEPAPEPAPEPEAAPEKAPASASPVAEAEQPPKAAEAVTEPPPVRQTAPPPPIHRGPPPPPPPPPPPLIPDTQPVVDKPPEPERQDFRYRALPARKPETPPTTAAILAATAAQPAAEQPAAGRPGFLAQVKQAIGIDEEPGAVKPGAPAATTGAAARTTAAAAGAPATPAPPASTASAAVKPEEPAALKPQATQPQARQPQVQQPDARKPTAELKRRVVAAPPRPAGEPEYKAGDLICGNCGAGNDPTRRFCRKCGTNLVDAVVVAPPPWYKRIFRRRDRALMAGQRPAWMGDQERARGGLMGTLNRFFRLRRLVMGLLVGAAALGILSYVALPDVKGKVDQGIDQVRQIILPSYGPISPHNYVGSVPPLKGHEEEFAFDGGSNTYWAATSGPTLTLTVTFDRPFDLGALLLSTAPVETRTQFDRPKTVEVTFPNSDAKPIVLNLADSDKQIQNSGLDAKGVSVVVLAFRDYYPAAAGGDNLLALTDIQFQERK